MAESAGGQVTRAMLTRRATCAATLAAAICAGARAAEQPPTPPSTTLLRAARLFDGKNDATIPDAAIVVQGSRITAVGSRLPVPAGAQVVELGDATILPGFIDAHTHLTDESSDDWNADTVAGLRRGVPEATEHGSFLDDEAVRMMKERGTYLVPTLMAGEYAGGRKATRTYAPEIAAKALAALDGRSAAFKRAVGVGVKIAFGTDSGVSPHGHNAEEFSLLVEHGLSAAAALRTSAAAAALLGIDRVTGTLDAGKEADIVAVPGDVLRTITATEHVRFVMKGGKIVRNDPAVHP